MAEKSAAELAAEARDKKIEGIKSRGKRVWTRKKKAVVAKAPTGPVPGGVVKR